MSFRNAIAAFFAAVFLAACGGGSYESKPLLATAEEVSQAYWAAPALFNRSVIDRIVGTDEGGYRITVVEDGQVLYNEASPDFDYLAGVLLDGTPLRLISAYDDVDHYFPDKQFLFVGAQRFDVNLKATRAGRDRRIMVVDVSEGAGDWLVLYAVEIPSFTEETDDGQYFSYWALINRYSGKIEHYGYYDESLEEVLRAAGGKRRLAQGGWLAKRVSHAQRMNAQ